MAATETAYTTSKVLAAAEAFAEAFAAAAGFSDGNLGPDLGPDFSDGNLGPVGPWVLGGVRNLWCLAGPPKRFSDQNVGFAKKCIYF